jgi:hypothetical protein
MRRSTKTHIIATQGFHAGLPCCAHPAVCVTKLGDPRVLTTAQDLDMMITDDSAWGCPRVHETDAQALFNALSAISKSGNGD